MKYLVRILVALTVLVGVYLAGRQSSGADSTTTTTLSSTPASFSAFYLDIGASASLGFQPTGIVHHNGERTNTGYANDLIYRESLRGVALTLSQGGCPGETVESMVTITVVDHCYTPPMTQLIHDEQYLQAQQGTPGVVTIDLGFNDMRVCLNHTPADAACISHALAAVSADLPKVMAGLKHAAGARVRFVGLLYNDPYLGYYVNGLGGASAATVTLQAMNSLNAVLTRVYRAAGAAVANVPALFATDNTTRVTVPNVGVIPLNVEDACAYTWFCYHAPFGPDDHPNNAGYSLIAQAIEDVLPARW